MHIMLFTLIVTVAAFSGSLAGTLMAHAAGRRKRNKRRATHGTE